MSGNSCINKGYGSDILFSSFIYSKEWVSFIKIFLQFLKVNTINRHEYIILNSFIPYWASITQDNLQKNVKQLDKIIKLKFLL